MMLQRPLTNSAATPSGELRHNSGWLLLLAVEEKAVVLDDDPENLVAVLAELQEGIRHPSQGVFVGRPVDGYPLKITVVVKDGVHCLVVHVTRLHFHDSEQ